jgi:hypothetical protein
MFAFLVFYTPKLLGELLWGGDMSDSPGYYVLFCKLQKGSLTNDKRSYRNIENPF